MRKFNNGKGKMYKPAVEEIVLGYLYPRLDVHVTEQRCESLSGCCLTFVTHNILLAGITY